MRRYALATGAYTYELHAMEEHSGLSAVFVSIKRAKNSRIEGDRRTGVIHR
jgi:hypothetical protein